MFVLRGNFEVGVYRAFDFGFLLCAIFMFVRDVGAGKINFIVMLSLCRTYCCYISLNYSYLFVI